MSFDHYTIQEYELYSAHMRRVMESRLSAAPMTPLQEAEDAQRTEAKIKRMWDGANEAFLESMRMMDILHEQEMRNIPARVHATRAIFTITS